MDNMKTPKCLASLLAVAVAYPTHAGVYVTVDDMQPSSQFDLVQAQIEHTRAATAAIERSSQSTEFIVGKLAELQYEQQLRADAKSEKVYEEQKQLARDWVAINDDRRLLASERNQLAKERFQMEESYQQKHGQLISDSLKKEEQLMAEQRKRDELFQKERSEFAAQSLAMQKQLKHSHDELLAKQLEHNAPSNVIVMSSNNASNVTAKVVAGSESMLDDMHPSTTVDQLVNMNQFIRSIIPTNWTYFPPAGTSSKQISLVQGRDWKSIINTIGVQHPYLQIVFDIPKKHLVITSKHGSSSKTPDPVRTWEITRSKSLRTTIEDFAKQVNWQVIWDTQNVDYPILANAVLTGDFAGKNGVLNQLMISTQQRDFPLMAKWQGHNVVRIIRRGSQRK